jgi:hypothetical protein
MPDRRAAIARSRDQAIACANACDDFRGKNTVILNVSRITPLFDFFVITTGTNTRQMRAIAEGADHAMKEHGSRRQGADGRDSRLGSCTTSSTCGETPSASIGHRKVRDPVALSRPARTTKAEVFIRLIRRIRGSFLSFKPRKTRKLRKRLSSTNGGKCFLFLPRLPWFTDFGGKERENHGSNG